MKRDGKYILIVLAVWFLFVCGFSIFCPPPKNYGRPVSGQSGGKKQTVTVDPLECQNLKIWYDSNNEIYFLGFLPKTAVVEYGKPMGRDGYEVIALTTLERGTFHITFSKKYALASKVSHLYLFHEMCHVETWNEFDEHGPRWKDCMHRIEAAGAFEGLL